MPSIEISKNLQTSLLSLSKKMDCSFEQLVEKALSTYLEDMEDYYTALERIEQHERNDEETYSLEEAAKELGLKPS